MNELSNTDLAEPSVTYLENLQKAFGKDGPCSIHLYLMLTYTLFSSINFHTIIPYLNN